LLLQLHNSAFLVVEYDCGKRILSTHSVRLEFGDSRHPRRVRRREIERGIVGSSKGKVFVKDEIEDSVLTVDCQRS
jgi:hypothetical protein